MHNKETADKITEHGKKILQEASDFIDKVDASLDDIGNSMDRVEIPTYKPYYDKNNQPKESSKVGVTVIMRGRWNIFKRLIKGIFTGNVRFTIQKK